MAAAAEDKVVVHVDVAMAPACASRLRPPAERGETMAGFEFVKDRGGGKEEARVSSSTAAPCLAANTEDGMFIKSIGEETENPFA